MSFLTENIDKKEVSEKVLETIMIKSKRAPVAVLILLFLIVSVCMMLPLASIVMVIVLRTGFSFGYLIAYVFFWAASFYLLKVLLWNLYGKEYLHLYKGRILYEADYKWFKASRQELPADNLKSEIIPGRRSKGSEGRLLLSGESGKMETSIDTSIEKLDEIMKKIGSLYGN